ncbi:MAG: dTDP-4-dehydrorhamnose 3,5-epimerase family protein [Planctomycetes bacterium]|nr:dTDP-4-dehydrorhamnose 3,5-epimerase family protein [Planctomycetota bacterium]
MQAFEDGPIEGVVVRDLVRHDDHRGWLAEVFRQDEIRPEHKPVMGYVSVTRPGVVRGPHEHRDQTDFFCFVGPGTFQVHLWDNRPLSPTAGRRMVLEAGAVRKCVVIIPPGVVHAYQVISAEEGLVINLPNRLFQGEGKREPVDEIRWEDAGESATPFKLG